MSKRKVIVLTLLILVLIEWGYVSAILEEFTINIYDESGQPINDNFELAVFSFVYENGQQDIAQNQYLDFWNWLHNTYANDTTAQYNFTVIKKMGWYDMYFHTTDIKLSYVDLTDTNQNYIFDTYFLVKLLNANFYPLPDTITNIGVNDNNAYYLILKHKQYDPTIFSSTSEDVLYPIKNILKIDFSSAEDFDYFETNLEYSSGTLNWITANWLSIDLDVQNDTDKYLTKKLSVSYHYSSGSGNYYNIQEWTGEQLARVYNNDFADLFVGVTASSRYYSWTQTVTIHYDSEHSISYTPEKIDTDGDGELEDFRSVAGIFSTPIKFNSKIYYAYVIINKHYKTVTVKLVEQDYISKTTTEQEYEAKISDKLITQLGDGYTLEAGVYRHNYNDVIFYDFYRNIFVYFNFNTRLGLLLINVKQKDFEQFADAKNVYIFTDNLKDDMKIIVEYLDEDTGTATFKKYSLKLADWFKDADVTTVTRLITDPDQQFDYNNDNYNVNIQIITEDPVTGIHSAGTDAVDTDDINRYHYLFPDLNQENWFKLVAQVNWPKTAYDVTVYDKNGADVTDSVNIRVESTDCEVTKDDNTYNRFWISQEDYSKTCTVVISIENDQGAIIYQKSTNWVANGQLNSEIVDMSTSASSNSSSDEGSSGEGEDTFGDGYYFVIYDDTLQQVCDEQSYVFKTEDGQVLNFKVTDDCRIYIDWSQIDQDGDGLPDFQTIKVYKDGKLVREIDTTALKKNEDTIIFAYDSDEKFVLLINLYFNTDQTLSQLDYNDIRDDLINNIDISIKFEGNMVLQGVKQDNAIINLLKPTQEYSCKVIFDRKSATYTTRYTTYACLIDRKVLLDGMTYNVYVSAQTKIAKVLFGVIDLGVQMQQFDYNENMQYKRLDTFNFNIALTEDLQNQIEKKRMFRDFFLNTQFWAMLIIIALVVIVKYLTLSDKIAVVSGALVFLVLVALHIISSAYLILISLIAIVIASLKLSDKLTRGGSD
ncbi:hypothetical protein TEU_03305 [Thermococcus eurythermalis]|uniref:Uncharacterized protein n=1 Tax=Thermococcus eurythermalis TaxID=1505907 RepID=A0A097QSK9_9EURY|nr:hypothetical protein [Thermococcus eurythermalis]AIU69451.1 hypothetical protein TEU_03305 [Thermococcus eurythermalis]